MPTPSRPALCASVLIAFATACGPSLPPAYLAQVHAAEAARDRGYPGEAAKHWERAAAEAGSSRDRDEALYRAAQSHLDAGHRAQALAHLSRLVTTPGSERQARAHFDLAYLAIGASPDPAAYAQLRQALLKFPDSGLVARGASAYATWVEDTSGVTAARAALSAFQVGRNRLDEASCYLQAKLEERSGLEQEALRTYVRLITRYPYPKGAYWDEANLQAAALHHKLGEDGEATALLRRMLAQREQAAWTGSYEKSYSAAQFLLAEILEASGGASELAESQQLYESLGERYPTSRLRDDALWRAAQLARNRGMQQRACQLMARLRRELPQSRFAGCAHALCPQAPKADCADYVLRSLIPGGPAQAGTTPLAAPKAPAD